VFANSEIFREKLSHITYITNIIKKRQSFNSFAFLYLLRDKKKDKKAKLSRQSILSRKPSVPWMYNPFLSYCNSLLLNKLEGMENE